MSGVRVIIFMALGCIGLASCSKLASADPIEKYLGTYFVKRNTDIVLAGTGNHAIGKDSFLLTITRSANSKIKFSSQDNWTAALNKNNFYINPYETKQTFGVLNFPVQTDLTGFGTFSGDSIYTQKP